MSHVAGQDACSEVFASAARVGNVVSGISRFDWATLEICSLKDQERVVLTSSMLCRGLSGHPCKESLSSTYEHGVLPHHHDASRQKTSSISEAKALTGNSSSNDLAVVPASPLQMESDAACMPSQQQPLGIANGGPSPRSSCMGALL